jgi:hypothetical protein
MLVTVAVLVVIVVVLFGGREGDAAEDFGEFGFADDGELLRGRLGGVGVGQIVGDGYEAVGVCALIAVAADSGGDAVDCGFAVLVDAAGDVADAVGRGRPGKFSGGIVAGGVIVDGVGNAEFKAGLECVGKVPGLGRGVEDPLLDAGGGLRGGVGVESGVAGELVAFVGYVEGVGVGEPEAEGSCGCGEVLRQSGGEAGEDAHVVRETDGLEFGGVEGERRDGSRCAGGGDAYALGAGGAGGVDEVDGVDAVAAAALGEVDDVVEDGQAAEVIVFADLVGFVAEFGDGEAGERGGSGWGLEAFRRGGGVDELRAGAEDDAVGLRIAAVACVAGGVEEVCTVAVVQDGGATVDTALSVGLGEGELAVAIDGGYGAVEVRADGVGGINDAGRVGVGDVEGIDRRDVAHEGEELAVGG